MVVLAARYVGQLGALECDVPVEPLRRSGFIQGE